MPMALTELLAAMNSLPTPDLYELVVKGNTLLAKRKQAEREKNWANQGEAKETIDSSRERT